MKEMLESLEEASSKMKSTAVLLEQQDTVEIGKAPHQHSKSDEVPI